MTTTQKSAKPTVDQLLLQHGVEQFLYFEATLLDERRWDEWKALVADDIRYYMPLIRNVKFGEWEREQTREMQDVNWIDEGKDTLIKRILQIQTGVHWAEEPLSRIVHLITNVRITKVAGDEVHVKSNFFTYRNRVETETDLFVGRREDVLRRADVPGGFQIARRKVVLAQNVLLAKNLTLIF